jgi:hypothetical protein
MTTTLDLVLTWKDEFLTWEKDSYSNDLAFRFNEIWVPSLISNNNLVNFKIDSTKGYELDLNFYNIFDLYERNKYLINVDSSGKCTWKYPIKLMTVCQFNQQTFPFDSHECFIDFLSSASYSNQLHLIAKPVIINKIKESEFELIDIKTEDKFQITKTNSDNDYFSKNNSISVIRVTFLVKRKMIFYTNKIILPYFVFYVVTLFTYLLPVDSGEKKSLSTSILISSFYFFKDCLSFVSKTSFLSLLSLYFNLNLVFVFLCIVITTLIYSIYYAKRQNKPINKIVAFFCNKIDLKKEDIKKEAFWNKQKQQLNENYDKLKLFGYRSKKDDNYLKAKIKRELVRINAQLMNFDISSISMPGEKTEKSLDLEHFLAFKHLNVIKQFKNIIIAHNNNSQIIGNQKPRRLQNIPKRTKIFESNENSFRSMSLMNTLENLKLEILSKQQKIKSKSLNKIDIDFNDALGKLQKNLPSTITTSYQKLGSTELLNYLQKREERELNTRNARYFLEIVKEYKVRLQFYLGTLKNKNIQYQSIYKKELGLTLNYSNEWKSLAVEMDRKLFYIFITLATLCILYLYLKAILLI